MKQPTGREKVSVNLYSAAAKLWSPHNEGEGAGQRSPKDSGRFRPSSLELLWAEHRARGLGRPAGRGEGKESSGRGPKTSSGAIGASGAVSKTTARRRSLAPAADVAFDWAEGRCAFLVVLDVRAAPHHSGGLTLTFSLPVGSFMCAPGSLFTIDLTQTARARTPSVSNVLQIMGRGHT